MVTYSDYSENLTYGSFVNHSKDSVDNMMGKQLELCYETINCNQCYKTSFSVDCEGCTEVYFSKNCTGCNNCFGCVNLRKQSYHIFNQPYTKEEYEVKMKELMPISQEKINSAKEKAKDLWAQYPQKFIHGWRNVDSSGDYLNDTKNTKDCFIGFNFEDSRFCSFVTGKMTDTYDFTNFGEGSSYMYEVLQGGDQCSNLKMGHWVISNCQNLEYCFFMDNSKDCFACVGLKKRQYCIFNKQYSKEEYFKLREELIAHMNSNPYIDSKGLIYKYGEFFPIETSPFPYNETSAQEFFPLTKEQAVAEGYTWSESEKRNYQPTIETANIPETIDGVSENITGEIIACAHGGTCNDQCSSAFKIVPQELQFYKRMNLPLPHLCPQCRHVERLQYRNPMKLWNRECMCDQSGHAHTTKCPTIFKTTYTPDRTEKIYCESCYQQEVM